MNDRERAVLSLLGGMIVLDITAHLSNYIGVVTWIGVVPFDYGTDLYELAGAGYWIVALILLLIAFVWSS